MTALSKAQTQRLSPAIRLIIFVVCYLLISFSYLQIPDETLAHTVYYHGVTRVCADVINGLFPKESVAAFQNVLVSGQANLQIVRGCDGSGALFLLVSAIIAFPASVCWKLVGLVTGASLIYLINLIRIGGLYFIVVYRTDWFQLVHVYLAPSLIIILVCLFYAWWTGNTKTLAHGQ
ncbi:MAG: exosortase family protein XrtM [Methylococcaceae bacterium]|jgi:exosortase family protein XrtM